MINWPALKAANAPINAFVDWDQSATGTPTVGVKSNIAVKGLPWTGGMERFRGRIAEDDATVVAKLRKAGAAIIGSLNMHEAALGATTDNPVFGRTHNPHQIGYTPGGSSGGSAAAVAAGLCDFALGTDTLGSIRLPAAYCGIYGLKPTLGAVSTAGLAMLNPAFDVIGPMARSLDMLEQAWEMMADPVDGPLGVPLSRLITMDNAGIVDPAITSALNITIKAAGLPQQRLVLRDPLKTIRIAGLVTCCQWLHADLGGMDGLSGDLQAILNWGAKAEPRPDIIAHAVTDLIDAIGKDGVLILPTTSAGAFPHDSPAPADQADFTALASIAGLPALAMPAGMSDDRLPISVQLVGPPHSEYALIALARQLAAVLDGYHRPSHFLD